MQETLNKYLYALSKLKRGSTPYGLAPHKPILLISIIELIDRGVLTENKVYINADLVGTFKENWQLLVNTLNQADFTQPFYYLQSDKADAKPFWFLLPHSGCQINAHIKSVNTLAATVAYGFFNEELYLLLSNPLSRQLIKEKLLTTYFPLTQQKLQSQAKEAGYLHQLEDYVLNEPQARYKTIKIETEEDVFVRNGLFKKLIPKAYLATCSFTGMKLSSTYGHSFVDACHIIPFSITHDDQISNGIALCPNMHRAFDRGLLSIDENYKILVSPAIIEDAEHVYSINKLEGKQIHLPPGERYYPAHENLKWHRENIFKGK
ncbi:HNH endonuclease [Pedobacter glucosidilyticus]|uniref:HNH endonuclease n=1 Tax=Pedobacter glucosidilyticus TaxID=1122941 RepID=UPI0026EA4CEC|nr:HNH endonuclease [Pedobacter glucosidilyticus]